VSDTSIELARSPAGPFASREAAGTADAGAPVADYALLLKPRVMSLVVFTGFVGLYLAPGRLHPVLSAIAILSIAVGAGAAAPSTCGTTATSIASWRAP